jgi:hypothetical protein
MFMKSILNRVSMAALAVFLCLPSARGFPPAPEVLVYGLVKDQYGNPIANTSDKVILQTPSGQQIVTAIQPNFAIGINYALQVPMDSGISPPLYTINVLTNAQPYTLYVVDGGVTNLPIEMVAAPFPMAPPSHLVLKNLTLGTDANHDGIPDAWELAFLQSLGLNIALTNINPNAIYTPDGRTLYQEYLLGNYPYNANPFAITLVSQHAGSAVIAFTAAAGRTYSVYGSPDLKTWTLLSFSVPAISAQVVNSYFSGQIQPLQIQTVQPSNIPPVQFFRLSLQ